MTRVLAGLAAALALLSAGSAWAKPPMWIVRDGDSEILLFGSIHVLPPGLDWKPQGLTAAVAKANDVWFELPLDPATTARTSTLALQQGFLPRNQFLSTLLPVRLARQMARVEKTLGLTPAQLERMRPWLAELRLALAAFALEGASSEQGVEEQVSAITPSSAVRRAFETASDQISLFSDAPPSDQIASLRDTLDQLENDPGQYKRLLAAWMAGDVVAIDRDALAPMRKSTPGIYRRLITARNARWIKLLVDRLHGSGRTVVVVGAGHLVGPDGLPARLAALGYTVEGPIVEPDAPPVAARETGVPQGVLGAAAAH